jgi:hypothetical protein
MIPMVSRLAPFQHAFVQRLSELGIAYRGSPLSKAPANGTGRFAAGRRGHSQPLCFSAVRADRGAQRDARQLANLHDIVELRAGSQGHHLVRPDGYIAYSAHNASGDPGPSFFWNARRVLARSRPRKIVSGRRMKADESLALASAPHSLRSAY